MAAVIAAQSFQLNYSTLPSFSIFFQPGALMICVNILIVALPNLLLFLFLCSWRKTLLITNAVFTIWSIANYYVIEFHGSPLFLSELSNFMTAMAVAGNYHFSITKAVVGLLLVFVTETAAVFVISRLEKNNGSMYKSLFMRISVLGAYAAFVYVLLFSPYAVKPNDAIGWTWVTGIRQYGFASIAVEDAMLAVNSLKDPPAVYAPQKLGGKTESADVSSENCPDIILILNESLWDTDYYVSTDADDLFGVFKKMDNGVFGFTTVPDIGGGTNDSEYELLTSNSTYLLNRTAPFNFLHLNTNGNNVVQNLKKLSYKSFSMHCGKKTNYSRHKAYPALGFDNVLLGESAFSYFSTYGNRSWLDWDNYRDLIDQYEQADEAPRFFYLLTFQNHGGYEQNDTSYDTVQIQQSFGDLTDDMAEYMTSVQMSVEAFTKLTEYFTGVDRHVIVCMVGDHAPSFIKDLPAKKEMTYEESQIAMRMVPYIIWANYDVEYPEYTEYASMVDLVPMIMKTAGLPLTAYYQTILELHDILPIRTSTGIYMNRDGNIGVHGKESPYYDMLTKYYCMEYNALKAGSDYRKDLFEFDINGHEE